LRTNVGVAGRWGRRAARGRGGGGGGWEGVLEPATEGQEALWPSD